MTSRLRFYLRFFVLALCLGMGSLAAQEEAPVEAPDQPAVSEEQGSYSYPDFAMEERSFQDELFSMLSTLGLFLFGLLALAWVFNRLKQARNMQMNESSNIRILERRVIAPKGVLYLIEVMGEVMVVSESPAGLQFLTKLSIEEGGQKSFESIMNEQGASAGQ